MPAAEIRVWTYWEGPRNAMLDICEHSVASKVGSVWTPLNRNSVYSWMDLPPAVEDHDSPRVRSDYIRTRLLHDHGGVWLDSDVLLLSDITSLVGVRPLAWREDHSTRKRLQGMSIGVMVFPFPGSPLLKTCLEAYSKKMRTTLRHSMAIYHSAWSKHKNEIRIGSHEDFYLIPAKEWERFWTNSALLDAPVKGLHLWDSIVRSYKKYTKHFKTVQTLVDNFPESVLANYAIRHMNAKKVPR